MQIGPYSVLGEIARGGHGVVYRAQDPGGQVVALKLLLAHRARNDASRQRFQAEVDALSRLRHPHVVPILAAGEHEHAPWLALEFVEGESLGERLHRGPLPVDEAQRVVRQLAQALSYVHGCGVLHRDLKPDNVLLRGGDALLTDFGLVLDEQSSLSRITQTGALQGTPGYWAPEQAQGEKHAFGPATDVYGLGGVLYACLTGQPPVRASSLQEYAQSFLRPAPPPRALRPEVPRWLSELCMRCLAPEPSARPASADAVARALVLADSATGPRSRRGVRLALALALVGGGALACWAALSGSPEADGAAWFEASAASYKAGRFAQAIEECDRTLALDPDNAVAYARRAASKLRLGRHAEALVDFDRALQLDPEHAASYYNRGLLKANLGRYAEALEDYGHAIRLSPAAADHYVGRGALKVSLERHEDALADFDRALELDPQHLSASFNRGIARAHVGRDEEAIADFDRALQLDPGLRLYYHRALSKVRLARHADALADFDRAIERDPARVDALSNRGLCKAQLGRFEEAIADYDRALALEPERALSYANRAAPKAMLGRQAEALEDFDRALALGVGEHEEQIRQLREVTERSLAAEVGLPESTQELGARDWLDAAEAQDAVGDYGKAIQAYCRALQLEPELARALVGRGGAQAKLGRYAEAIEDFDRALTQGGLGAREAAVRNLREQAARQLASSRREAAALTAAAGERLAAGRFQEGLEGFDRALQLDPNHALAYTGRAACKASLGRTEDAIADYDRALQLDPNDVLAYAGRAACMGVLGRTEDAIADYGRVLQLDPGDAFSYHERGKLEAELGRHREALEDYDRALELGDLGPLEAQVRELRAEAARQLGD